MKKTLLSLSLVLLLASGMEAQTKRDWSLVQNSKEITVKSTAQRSDFPEDFKLFKIDLQSLKQKLYTAQDRFAVNANYAIIEIPNLNGKLERFKMYEASNFDAELQAQFPNIRAYVGQGIDNPNAQIRLSISPEGISTMTFKADSPTEYMEVYSADNSVYALYNRDAKRAKKPFTCTTPDEQLEHDLTDKASSIAQSSNPVYRTFRLAMSVTGEYSAFHGGTTPLVLAAVNTTLTRCNGVYEKDLAIHLNLVNNTTILYLNASTDPYGATDANYNNELQTTLTAQVGEANYDIGHLMSAIGNNGNAGCIGCICTNNQKGSGFTTSTSPIGDNFDIDFVVHEMGHQFGANHSFTFSDEDNSVNYEPGSGVTIMGYAGITSYDVAPHSIDTYHAGNIAQIQSNMTGKTCDVETAITHGTPVVNAGSNWTIPKSTPFALTGSATDTGGTANMTYQWEQYDEAAAAQLQAACPASPTKTAGPNFRSYLPTTSGTRYFPTMATTLSGSKTTSGADIIVEALSSVARTLNFRLTARDNALNGGQTNFGNMTVTVANIAALDITSQNTAGVVYTIGSTQTVTWTNAGNSTITGAANVDISFSNDNGVTWTTLLTNTPNDGTQAVTLPAGVSGAYCRFMVKANANIFFNVNTKAFAVGNYTYQTQNACIDYPFTLNQPITEDATTSYPGLSLNIADSYTITDANFFANVTHPNIGQFSLLIMAPWQATLNTAVWYGNTCTEADMNKWFDTSGLAVNCANTNDASLFRPFSTTNINAYSDGTHNSAGAWKIYFKDTVEDANVDNASFNTFTIQLCKSELVPVLLANESFSGLDNFSLYPNPNKGNFTIKFNSNSNNNINVTAHDLRGRQVYTKSFENKSMFNEEIQLKNVEAGIYIVTIEDGGKKEVKKIIIQ